MAPPASEVPAFRCEPGVLPRLERALRQEPQDEQRRRSKPRKKKKQKKQKRLRRDSSSTSSTEDAPEWEEEVEVPVGPAVWSADEAPVIAFACSVCGAGYGNWSKCLAHVRETGHLADLLAAEGFRGVMSACQQL